MGKVLLKSTFQIEDTKNPDWRERTGEPTVYVEATGHTLVLNGQPTSGYVKVGYIQRPTAMTTDESQPDERIPEVFHQHLKYFAAGRLFEHSGKGRDINRANDCYQRFLGAIGAGPIPIASHVVDR